MKANVLDYAARGLITVIFGQTLFFKLTYAPETQVIFGDLGGRPAATLAALIELAAIVLLWLPRKTIYGAGLALGAMFGAVVTHLAFVGVAVPSPDGASNDGGLLFGMALIVIAAASFVAYRHRTEVPVLGPKAVSVA
ncbi:MAG: DoxX-like family protein [Planctomycetota bacterium]